MGWPLKARRSLFLDWPWLCDESSPHRRALHIPVQILAGKFKMEFLPTTSLTKAFPVAQICSNLQKIVSSSSSHSQGQSEKRLLMASRGHPPRILAYRGSCIDPTHQSHTLDPTLKAAFQKLLAAIRLLIKDYPAGNDFMQVWTNLCYRVCF